MQYSPQIWQRFRNPRHAGLLVGPDLACGEARTPASSAVLSLQLRIRQGLVEDARFQALGCPSTIAAGDWLCEWLQRRSVAEAGNLTAVQLADALQLVAVRRHCAVLAEDALRAALAHAASAVPVSKRAEQPG